MKDILIVRDEDRIAFEMYPNTDANSGNQIVINSFSYDDVANLKKEGKSYEEIVEILEVNCVQFCYDFGDENYDTFLRYYRNIVGSGNYILISDGEILKGESA